MTLGVPDELAYFGDVRSVADKDFDSSIGTLALSTLLSYDVRN